VRRTPLPQYTVPTLTTKWNTKMFDFEKLEVYKKAKDLNKEILKYLRDNKQIDSYLRDQLKRASISIVINIAEGSGKFSKADKKNFYTISRGSVYECASLLELLLDESYIEKEKHDYFKNNYEIISRMLYKLIESQIQTKS
jgi:four helix bundle protein